MKECTYIVIVNDVLYLETGLKAMIPKGYTRRSVAEAPKLPLPRYHDDVGTKQVSYGLVSGNLVNPSYSWQLICILREGIPF